MEGWKIICWQKGSIRRNSERENREVTFDIDRGVKWAVKMWRVFIQTGSPPRVPLFRTAALYFRRGEDRGSVSLRAPWISPGPIDELLCALITPNYPNNSRYHVYNIKGKKNNSLSLKAVLLFLHTDETNTESYRLMYVWEREKTRAPLSTSCICVYVYLLCLTGAEREERLGWKRERKNAERDDKSISQRHTCAIVLYRVILNKCEKF